MKDIIKHTIVGLMVFQAKFVLKKRKPKIICVTGSVGKTSTKDAIAKVLSSKFKVRKSTKSYNSEFGVPLTILGLATGWNNPFLWFYNIILGFWEMLGLGEYPQWLVLEVGADHPGDIRKVAKWLPSDIAVITSFPDMPVHVEFFSSPEALYKEDMQIALNLTENKKIITNGDDKNIKKFLSQVKAGVETVGFKASNDWNANKESLVYGNDNEIAGLSFPFKYNKKEYEAQVLGSLGHQQIYIILSALAVGQSAGLNVEEGLKALADFAGPPGRLKIIPGIKNTTILDDSYNSSPVALESALETLSQIKTKGRRIAVLGDMLELGEMTGEAHKKAGQLAADKCQMILAVGMRSKFILNGARDKGVAEENLFYFDNSVSAGRKLQEILEEGDMALVKGSQSMRMEKIVEEVMLEPNKKGDLLCRQEKVWKKK